jgi:SH3 domain protein
VKKLPIILTLFFVFADNAAAKTVYVTDNIKFTLRSSESNRSKILKMLPSGTPLTVIQEKSSGYSKVRTPNGVEGYILTRHTQEKPISRWYLNKANKQLEALKSENERISKELEMLKTNSTTAQSSLQQVTSERDRLRQELNELKQTAANAVQLKHQRDQLQERVITVERELQQVKRENQALQDSANQDWFLYGGLLALFGVILGFILPKLSWRRKVSNWDTF